MTEPETRQMFWVMAAEREQILLRLSQIQARLAEASQMIQANVRATERLTRLLTAKDHTPLPGQGTEAHDAQ